MLHPEIKKKLPQILALFKQYKVQHAYAFGSATTDNFTKVSDVDFLLAFQENVSHSEYAANYFGLYNSLKSLLDREVDLVIQKTLKNRYFIEELNETKVLVYEQEGQKIPVGRAGIH